MQNPSKITSEFASVCEFLAKHPNTKSWPDSIPNAPSQVQRIATTDTQALQQCFSGQGSPCVVTDACWGWTFTYFQNLHPSPMIRANNRAPARHADSFPGNGGPQHSIQLPLADYIRQHCLAAPSTLDGHLHQDPPLTSNPYYLNGWRAFVEIPELKRDCPLPQFADGLDQTVELLRAVDAQLFNKGGQGAGAGQLSETDSVSDWCSNVDANLTKVFMGPPGTVTRLHFDAGEAHGWLAQVVGRKLFILFPPDRTTREYLYPLGSEKETEQSPIDPLFPDYNQFPLYRHAQPQCCIVHPGEAILIPNGWWHWAVALDRSITVQRNFYNAGSNASGLVKMVLKTAATLRGEK